MRKDTKGFTLIELVVVVAVLGILAGIAIPRFMNSTASARGSRILGDLRTIDSAITIYHTRTGKYPTEISELVGIETSDSGALLAAVPVPPTGKFIVARNNGEAGEFESQATDYTIADGRAKYECKTSGGAQPVEWYLAGTKNTVGDYMGKIVDILMNSKDDNGNYIYRGHHIDSFGQGEGNLTIQFNEALQKEGIDLEALGAKSWSVTNDGILLWTTQDISGMAKGTSVTIMRYNFATNDQYKGYYSVWNTTVAVRNDYNILQKPSNGEIETSKNASKEDKLNAATMQAIYDAAIKGQQ